MLRLLVVLYTPPTTTMHVPTYVRILTQTASFPVALFMLYAWFLALCLVARCLWLLLLISSRYSSVQSRAHLADADSTHETQFEARSQANMSAGEFQSTEGGEDGSDNELS